MHYHACACSMRLNHAAITHIQGVIVHEKDACCHAIAFRILSKMEGATDNASCTERGSKDVSLHMTGVHQFPSDINNDGPINRRGIYGTFIHVRNVGDSLLFKPRGLWFMCKGQEQDKKRTTCDVSGIMGSKSSLNNN